MRDWNRSVSNELEILVGLGLRRSRGLCSCKNWVIFRVQALVSEIRKLQDARGKYSNERRQLEQNLAQSEQAIEKLAKDKKNLQNQKQNLIQKSKNFQKLSKDTLQKLQAQKQQILKQLRQSQTRQKAFQTQTRKRDQAFLQLKQKFTKFQQVKDRSSIKNTFEILNKFEYGPSIYDMISTNSENQYGRLAKDCKDETVRRLVEENSHLKDCLMNLYKELNTVLELKKETLKNKKGYDGEYENYFQLNVFKPEVLHLSDQWSRDKLRELNQNVQKFKEAIRLGDQAESRVDERKQGCVNGIKQIIKNYKKVVDTQDQLLNKVLAKSKEFKASEMAALQNRFTKTLDNTDIERSKRFMEQQAQYLEVKNQELEKTKRMMQAVMKKAEQKKREAIKQKEVFQEEALQMRRSIEILPAVIEDELSKALT